MPSSSIKSILFIVWIIIKFILFAFTFPTILTILLSHFELFENISKDGIYNWLSSVYESLLIAFSIILPLLYGFITNTKSPCIKRQAYLNFKHSLFAFLLFMFVYFYVSYLTYIDKNIITKDYSQLYPLLYNFYKKIQFIFNNQSLIDFSIIYNISCIICAGLNQIYQIGKSVWQFVKEEEALSIMETVNQQYDELKNKISELSQKKEEAINDTSMSDTTQKNYIDSLEAYISSCKNLIWANFEISKDYSKKL